MISRIEGFHMWGELALSLKNGNVYMLIIAGLSFITCTIILERIITLQFIYNLDFPKFLTNLKKMVNSEDHDRAINLCRSASKTSLPKIALRALEAVENDPSTVRGTIEEETIEFIPRLESRLNFMPAIATTIMLVGILGTIDSLWWAFHSIDVLDTAKKQASLANGIAGSLNPTAIGIISSMIILAAHQLLKSMSVRVIDRIHHGVTVLSNLLVPEEVVATTVVSSASGIPATSGGANPDAIVDSGISEDVPPLNSQEEVTSDEVFDDAVVDDIKDEEEII